MARQIALGQTVEVVHRLCEGTIEALLGTLVLDQQYALPEAVDAALLELLAGARDGHMLLERRNTPPLDAEHMDERVPEALRLGTLGGFVGPLLAEGDGAT